MSKLQLTQEQADRWQTHLEYVASLTRTVGRKKVTPEKASAVLKMYNECGSKRMVSRNLHLATLTVTKILDAQGVPA